MSEADRRKPTERRPTLALGMFSRILLANEAAPPMLPPMRRPPPWARDLLGVLITPRAAFMEIAMHGRGFDTLLVLLVLELAMKHPLTIAGAIMRLP